MQNIIIQKVSENMADATVGTWFVREGEAVRMGDPVVELITEKATFEIEAEQDGILLKQFASSKSILPVGFTVAVIGTEHEEIPSEIEQRNRDLLQAPGIDLPGSVSSAQPRSSPGTVKATPAARRKAANNDIPLSEIQKSLNIDGVISEKDVERYIKKGS